MFRILLILLSLFFIGCNSKTRIPVSYEQTAEPKWEFSNIELGIQAGQKQKKYVLVMWTDPSYCKPCVMMERNVLPNIKIRSFLKKHYIFVRVKPHGDKYPKRGIPDYSWINPYSKKVVKISPSPGYMSVNEFYKLISKPITEE